MSVEVEPSAPKMVTFGDVDQLGRRRKLVELLRACPIPQDEVLLNMALFLVPQTLGRTLFMDFLYRQIIDVQGCILELGCRWGQNISLFSSLRGIYEPFNRLRRIVGFDTFEGFPNVSAEDGAFMGTGDYGTTPGYAEYLNEIIGLMEQESPLQHVAGRTQIIKGDATETLQKFLTDNPEVIVSLAYFDMDIYEPTKKCLQLIKSRLTRGAVIGFDEANDHATPGETVAIREVFGLNNISVRRYPASSRTSYIVFEG